MKKKILSAAVIVAILALTVTVPQVQAFAATTLSIFRVGDAKTIDISIDDIAQMSQVAMDYADNNQDKISYDKKDDYEKDAMEEGNIQQLTNVDEFIAFDVSLPKELKDQQPELTSIQMVDKTIAMQDGQSVTISLSPVLVATYEHVTFLATQGMNNDMTSAAKQEMQQKVLSSSILTDNLRSQLAAIDPNTKDIYLPVITGITREADLGGTTGYLYATADLQSIMSALPADLTAQMQGKKDTDTVYMEQNAPTDNTRAIIWTKNGVLYALMGDVTDNELIAIARSVR